MERLPQVLINVPDVDKSRVATSRRAGRRRRRGRARAGRHRAGCCCGPPGTEPLVRVMVEAADIEQARSVAGRLADAVKSALG